MIAKNVRFVNRIRVFFRVKAHFFSSGHILRLSDDHKFCGVFLSPHFVHSFHIFCSLCIVRLWITAFALYMIHILCSLIFSSVFQHIAQCFLSPTSDKPIYCGGRSMGIFHKERKRASLLRQKSIAAGDPCGDAGHVHFILPVPHPVPCGVQALHRRVRGEAAGYRQWRISALSAPRLRGAHAPGA